MTELQHPVASAAPAAEGSAPAPRARRRVLQFSSHLLLGIAALVGIMVILAAVAPLVGLQAVRLATGSMSPTYPAGSVVVVRDVPADTVAVGDVVTIVRSDGTPVTHRIVEHEPMPGGATIRMRGDANAHDDPAPYIAARVGLVLGGVPAIGYFFALAEHPLFVPLAATIVALLVLWAWWPERRSPRHRKNPEPSERRIA
ncbi:signal peptidase I [Salinibacterium sp. ZJ77]|uniref:signal peptidase I n=1 Tax=Salinibacterium sp. ZJ77 TaxID=2708337 RepID=UPI001420083D|nr:signal peptidase I [Salinibacterium sp. ZJ77]